MHLTWDFNLETLTLSARDPLVGIERVASFDDVKLPKAVVTAQIVLPDRFTIRTEPTDLPRVKELARLVAKALPIPIDIDIRFDYVLDLLSAGAVVSYNDDRNEYFWVAVCIGDRVFYDEGYHLDEIIKPLWAEAYDANLLGGSP